MYKYFKMERLIKNNVSIIKKKIKIINNTYSISNTELNVLKKYTTSKKKILFFTKKILSNTSMIFSIQYYSLEFWRSFLKKIDDIKSIPDCDVLIINPELDTSISEIKYNTTIMKDITRKQLIDLGIY